MQHVGVAYVCVPASVFNTVLKEARVALGRRGFFVSLAAADTQCFLSWDRKSGFGLNGKDFCSAFSLGTNRLPAMLATAENILSMRGESLMTLDCFDPLTEVYARYGFGVQKVEPWEDQWAPEGWPKALGQPSVAYMAKLIVPALKRTA